MVERVDFYSEEEFMQAQQEEAYRHAAQAQQEEEGQAQYDYEMGQMEQQD